MTTTVCAGRARREPDKSDTSKAFCAASLEGLLLTMLEAVYLDPVEERSIVAFRPKPTFQALFQMAATK